MAEGQEGLPKESVISKISRLKNRLLGRSTHQPQPQGEGLSGTRTTEQIEQAAQLYPESQPQPQVKEPAQTPVVTGREPTPEARNAFKLFGQEITHPSQQVSEKAPGWTRHEAEKIQAAEAPKTVEQLAEEARIDAEILAKLQQPSQPSEPLPKVAPLVTEQPQETTLPSKVFEPQPEVSGEHAGVDEFLKTKPQPTTETPAQPSETATQAPAGETIPVQSQPQEEQPIPVNIPQRAPVNVGDEVR